MSPSMIMYVYLVFFSHFCIFHFHRHLASTSSAWNQTTSSNGKNFPIFTWFFSFVGRVSHWSMIYTNSHTIRHCLPTIVLHRIMVRSPCAIRHAIDCTVVMNQHRRTMLLVEMIVLYQTMDSVLKQLIQAEMQKSIQAMMVSTMMLAVY